VRFELGTSGLLAIDQHLIKSGRAAVDLMTVSSKKAWLQNITIAGEIFDNEIETETTRTRNCMIQWQRGIRNHNN
jgi:hypothetical protein